MCILHCLLLAPGACTAASPRAGRHRARGPFGDRGVWVCVCIHMYRFGW